MSEPIENEIEEELRRKQIKSLWDRFGLYLITIILIIIISFGGYEFSSYLSRNNSEAASDEYQKAIMAVNEDRINDAEDIFPSYEKALNRKDGKSTILVEFCDYYNEK